jgi:hypothetical protein
MERPRIFHPQLSRHAAKLGKQAFCVNIKNRPISEASVSLFDTLSSLTAQNT